MSLGSVSAPSIPVKPLDFIEPPFTDPYARWCGRGGAVRLPPIPIVAGLTWSPVRSWVAALLSCQGIQGGSMSCGRDVVSCGPGVFFPGGRAALRGELETLRGKAS